MAVWASLFLAVWQRTQVRHAMLWGMVGFENEETDRPEFAELPETVVIHSSL